MQIHIRILPHGRKITAAPGKSLMEVLMNERIFLRSDCGGKGTCGKCRVKRILSNGHHEMQLACTLKISEDISIEIPESSLSVSHIINKAPLFFPASLTDRFKNAGHKVCHGIAVDLGTTTIAVYLCNMTKGQVLSSIALKNPQSFYGDDVMSRIGAIGRAKENLGHLQRLVVRAIEWGIQELLTALDLEQDRVSQMVVVGNPTMVHILAGIDPAPIGMSPYHPVFYDARKLQSADLGFAMENISIQTLPQVSGFIGGDILSAALAADLDNQPQGTLLIDLGTNGELLLKEKDHLFATSCATGPAFEGASLSCGMQAIPGAINKVEIKTPGAVPLCSFINPSKFSRLKPSGICGTGVINTVAQLCTHKIIKPDGAFNREMNLPGLGKDASGKMQYTLGMIPVMDMDRIEIAGNSAGAGAVMTLCDDRCLERSIQMVKKITTIDLACSQAFQEVFVQQLGFPDSAACQDDFRI